MKLNGNYTVNWCMNIFQDIKEFFIIFVAERVQQETEDLQELLLC